jgi:hypothetical protein
MDRSGPQVVVTPTEALPPAASRTGEPRVSQAIALLVRPSPTSLRLATLDAEGRELLRSNDLPVVSEHHPARYRLALQAGGSGTVLAPLGARHVVARVEDAGGLLRPGEPIPGHDDVYEWTARLHHGRGVTVRGARAVHAWTAAGGWREHCVGPSDVEGLSLDERGRPVAIAVPALASRSPVCRITRWAEDGAESLAYRLPWRDWARLKLQGCDKLRELDASGPVWIATTDSEWFFDSRAAYVVVLNLGGRSHAKYRRDFTLSAVRWRGSGGALVVGMSGDILEVEPSGRGGWRSGSNSLRQTLRDAARDLARAWVELMVFGADASEETLVMCVGLYSQQGGRLVAEAVVESREKGAAWSVLALRPVDPAVPWGRWCDVALEPG